MRLASSCTVIVSGTSTSRYCLAAGPACWWARFSFSRARRSAARLRVRLSSSPVSARETVSLPAWRRSSTGRDWRRDGPGSAASAHGLARRGRRNSRSSSIGSAGRFGSGLGRFLGGEALGLGSFLGGALRRPLPRPCDFPRRGAFRLRSAPASSGPRGGALPRASSCALLRPRAAGVPAFPCAR